MDVIERYLASVRILLPRARRDDIVAELRDVLTGSREEHATQLSRPLTLDEEEGLLREFGHPVIVAARYGPQQYLIGPDLYPAYVFVLKLVLVIVAVAVLLVGLIGAVASINAAGIAAARAVEMVWNGAFSAVGVVTIIFACLQRYSPRLQLLSNWRARDLPALRKPKRVTWFNHVAGIVANAFFILWWTNVVEFTAPLSLGPNQSLSLAPAPVWQALNLPVLVLAFTAIALHSFRLMRQTAYRLASMLDLALQFGILAVASLALRAGHWVVVAGSGVPESTVMQIDNGANIGLEVALGLVVCLAVIRGAYDLWQLFRGGEPT